MTARILIVDDMPANTRLLGAKLAAEYYQVSSARDGFEALSIARDWQPDLILLDISFPADMGGVEWDGFRIMDWFRRLETAKKIPIIVITGSENPKDRERATGSGAVAFFHKPIDHDDLLKVIRATLASAPKPS